MPPTIVMISDTHGFYDRFKVPKGDILIHAGDMTKRGKLDEVERFNEFLRFLPHPHKIVIAGNHDFAFEEKPETARRLLTNCTYLQDSSVEVEGITIYGSPWQPWFHDWAFNVQRGIDLQRKWALIPDQVDILVTHGPPRGIGDKVYDGRNEGCDDLLARVLQVKPKYHLFGHIHEAAGVYRQHGITFVNAACLKMTDEQTTVGPFVFDYATGELLKQEAETGETRHE